MTGQAASSFRIIRHAAGQQGVVRRACDKRIGESANQKHHGEAGAIKGESTGIMIFSCELGLS